LRGVLLGTRDHPGLALHEARRHLFHWQRSGTPAGVRFKIGEPIRRQSSSRGNGKGEAAEHREQGLQLQTTEARGNRRHDLEKTSRSPLGETHQAVNSLANSLARVLGPRHRDL